MAIAEIHNWQMGLSIWPNNQMCVEETVDICMAYSKVQETLQKQDGVGNAGEGGGVLCSYSCRLRHSLSEAEK